MTKTEELKLCQDYINKIKSKEICAKYHCSTTTLHQVLDKNGIPKRQTHNYKKDLSKLFDLSNPDTQYWLGFICADGNIAYNIESRLYKVSLFSKDQEVIDKFTKYMGKENVSFHKRKQNGILEVYISSKILCEYFINKLNITPNKSLTLNPNIKYTSDFIRGYFDGDGSIRNSTEKQVRYECNITCASKEFIDKIKQILDNLEIYSIIYQHTDCNAYKIRIDRKADSRKFYEFLYKNAKTYLERKRNNFVALFGNLEEKKLGELREQVGKSAAKQEEQNLLEGSTTNN